MHRINHHVHVRAHIQTEHVSLNEDEALQRHHLFNLPETRPPNESITEAMNQCQHEELHYIKLFMSLICVTLRSAIKKITQKSLMSIINKL